MNREPIVRRFADALNDYVDLSTKNMKVSGVTINFGEPTRIRVNVRDWEEFRRVMCLRSSGLRRHPHRHRSARPT